MPDQEPDIEEEDEYENQHEGLQEDSDDDIQVAQNLGQDSDPIGTNRVPSPTEEDDGHDHDMSRIEHVRSGIHSRNIPSDIPQQQTRRVHHFSPRKSLRKSC